MESTDARSGFADFVEEERLVMLIDIAGALRAMDDMTDTRMASYLDTFYHRCTRHVVESGGEVIKYVGDACLATFPPENLERAIGAVAALRSEFVGNRDARSTADIGINAHVGNVVIGEFGPLRRRDIMGRAVSTTFLLGGGPGIRLTERAFRRLPDAARERWRKVKPPTTYTVSW